MLNFAAYIAGDFCAMHTAYSNNFETNYEKIIIFAPADVRTFCDRIHFVQRR